MALQNSPNASRKLAWRLASACVTLMLTLAWVLISGSPVARADAGEDGASSIISDDGSWEFIVGSDGNAIITRYYGAGERVRIPPNKDGTITGADGVSYPVSSVSGSVRIESGTIIYTPAFKNNVYVKEVYLYNPVTLLEKGAFEGCTNLTNVYFYGGTLETIGEECFKGCTRLESVSFPGQVASIGESAFSGCSSLSSVSFAEDTSGALSIGSHAFGGTALESVILPTNLDGVGANVFDGCAALKRITFSSVPSTINQDALAGSASVTMIDVPFGWRLLPTEVGSSCRSFIVYRIEDDGTATIMGQRGIADGLELRIPGVIGLYQVKGIASQAFFGETNIQSVTFDDDCAITSVGSEAFRGCAMMEQITLPASVTEIGDWCFMNCISLTSDPLTKISNLKDDVTLLGCFSGCTALEQVSVPDGVATIGEKCFDECTGLTSVTLPNSVTRIDKSFNHCVSLETVVMPDARDDIIVDFKAFAGCKLLTLRFKVRVGSGAEAWIVPLTIDDPPGAARFPETAVLYDPVSLSDSTVLLQVAEGPYVYNAKPQVPAVEGSRWNHEIQSSDYVVVKEFSKSVDAGQAMIVITGDGKKFKGTRAVTFEIEQASVNTNAVQMNTIDPCPWDALEWTPTSSWRYDFGGTNIYTMERSDYDLSYANNTNASAEAEIILTGKGNFKDSKTFYFEIAKRDLKTEATISVDDQVYTGSQVTPIPKVTMLDRDKRTFELSEEYDDLTLSYSNNVEVGTATVTAVGKEPNVTGSISTTFQILQRDISGITVEGVEDSYTYTGADITPTVTVKADGITFVEGRDYDVAYADNHDIGTATVIITGKGGCKGTKVVTFEITPKQVSVSANYLEKEYGDDDPPMTASVKGLYGGDSISYELSREPGEDVGTYVISCTGEEIQGNYVVTFSGAKLTIDKANIFAASVDPISPVIFKGEECKPKPVVTFKESPLQEGTDYALSYERNVHAGNAVVNVMGMGNFKSYKAVYFTIEPRDISGSGTEVGVGFQQWTGSALEPAPAYVRVPKDNGGFFELEKDNDYTIFEYENNVDQGTGGITIKGCGDYTGTAVGRFEIVRNGRIDTGFIADIPEQAYTGAEITPPLRVFLDGIDAVLIEGVDYTVTCTDNVNVGIATVNVTGAGALADTGALSTTFNIVEASISSASVTVPDEQVYTGEELNPMPVVTMDDKLLTLGTDYEITSYANNLDAGEATITVTGKGNYKDKASGTFEIKRAPLVVATGAASKAYDGTALTEATATITGLMHGETATVVADGSQTEVGSSNNTYKLTWITAKAANYELDNQLGMLTVTENSDEVTITASSATKVYDGTALTSAGATAAGLPAGFTINARGCGSLVDVGETANPIAEGYMILNANGDDRTACFTNVKTVEGTLTVDRRPVVLTSASDVKTYDGFELTNDEVTVGGDGWVQGEGATYDVTGSRTVPGTSQNEFTYVLDGGTKAGNYEVTTVFGTLTVTNRPEGDRFPLMVTSMSGSSLYDGQKHELTGFEALAFNVVSGDDTFPVTVEGIDASAVGIDAGEYVNSVSGTPVVLDAEGNDVTSEFVVSTSEGTFAISPRQVTLTSATAEREYDGTPLTEAEVTVGGDGWAKDEGATYDVTGSQTVVGVSQNTFTYTLDEGTKASNYEIATAFGTLTVMSRGAKYQVTVVANSAEAVYDGAEHVANGFETLSFSVDGNEYEVSGLVTENPRKVDAGTYTNNISGTPIVSDAAGNDVSSEFAVSVQNGTLTIKKRQISMASASSEKVYDGSPLTKSEVAVLGDGFVGDEGAIYRMSGSQTAVGSSDNTFTFTLKGGAKVGNYEITTTFGTLTVTPANLGELGRFTVDAIANVTYDGKAHEPKPIVRDKVVGKVLVEGVDYALSYANNVEVGDAAVTVTGRGNYQGALQVTFRIVAPSVSYVLLSGGGASITQGSAVSLEFRFDRVGDGGDAFDHFAGLKMDDRRLDEGSFTKKRGSVVVTLKPEYVKTLSVGNHVLTALFDDGEVTASFTVRQGSVPPMPSTNDLAMPSAALGLLVAGGASAIAMGSCLRRRVRH